MKKNPWFKWKIGLFATVTFAALLQGVRASDAFTKAYDAASKEAAPSLAAANPSAPLMPKQEKRQNNQDSREGTERSDPPTTGRNGTNRSRDSSEPSLSTPNQQVQPQARTQTRTRRS